MHIRNRSTRSLLAFAITAVPLVAHAVPVMNLPSFNCGADGNMQSISWGDGTTLDGGGAGISAGIKPPNPNLPAVQSPFSCSNNLFSTGAVSGDSFSINFGQLPAVQDAQMKFEFSSFDYKDNKYNPGGIETNAGTNAGNKYTPTVSDFNLFLDAYDKLGALQNKYFVGVQLISQYGSAVSTDNKYFVDDATGNLIFDPSIPGGSAVIRLLSAPETVPEPPSLALLGMGLAGIASVLRRKRSK